MQCPQCADFLRPTATRCAECGWQARAARPAAELPTAWSPPTPPVRTPPWWGQSSMSAETEALLDALKTQLAASALGDRRQVLDAAQTGAYLAACRAQREGRPT